MVKISAKRATKGRSSSHYCAGFTDGHGIWNTGFYCPVYSGTDPHHHVCCGSDTVRYCCPMSKRGRNKSEDRAQEKHPSSKQTRSPNVLSTPTTPGAVIRHMKTANQKTIAWTQTLPTQMTTFGSSNVRTTPELTPSSPAIKQSSPESSPEILLCDRSLYCYSNGILLLTALCLGVVALVVSGLLCFLCKRCPLYKHRKGIRNSPLSGSPPCYETFQMSCGVPTDKFLCSDYYDVHHMDKSCDIFNPWEERQQNVMVNTAVQSKVRLEGPLFDRNTIALTKRRDPGMYSDIFIGNKYYRDSYILHNSLSDSNQQPTESPVTSFRPRTLASLAQLRPHSFLSDTTGDFPTSDLESTTGQHRDVIRTSHSSLGTDGNDNDVDWCGESDTDWSYCNVKVKDDDNDLEGDCKEMETVEESQNISETEARLKEVPREDGRTDEKTTMLGLIEHCKETGISYITV